MNISRTLCHFLLSFLGTVVLAGCLGKTPAVIYYTLSPAQYAVAERVTPTTADLAVGIGPVRFPDELDRSGIVTRSGNNRLDVNEYRRWGGSLEKHVTRVLEENLSSLLDTNRVMARPWEKHFNPIVRLTLDFRRFDGRLGEYAILDVTWMLVDPEGDVAPWVQRTKIQEAVSDTGYDALVAAQNCALSQLSKEIALVIAQRSSNR